MAETAKQAMTEVPETWRRSAVSVWQHAIAEMILKIKHSSDTWVPSAEMLQEATRGKAFETCWNAAVEAFPGDPLVFDEILDDLIILRLLDLAADRAL